MMARAVKATRRARNRQNSLPGPLPGGTAPRLDVTKVPSSHALHKMVAVGNVVRMSSSRHAAERKAKFEEKLQGLSAEERRARLQGLHQSRSTVDFWGRWHADKCESDPSHLPRTFRAAVAIQKAYRWWRFMHHVQEIHRSTQQRVEKMMGYLIFLVLFTIVHIVGRQNEDIYFFAHGIRNQLVGLEFNAADAPQWKKTFMNIETVADLKQYLDGPFYKVLYTDASFDNNNTARAGSRDGSVLGHNTLVGSPRIGQVRLRKMNCTGKAAGRFVVRPDKPLACWGDRHGAFQAELEDRKHPTWVGGPAKGAGAGAGAGASPPSFAWDFNRNLCPGGMVSLLEAQDGESAPADVLASPRWCGPTTAELRAAWYTWERTKDNVVYPAPGYGVVLPSRNSARARSMLDQLLKSNYVDQATRFLSIEFALYNVMLDQLMSVRLRVHLTRSGRVEPTFDMRSVDARIPWGHFTMDSWEDWAQGVLAALVAAIYGFYFLADLYLGVKLARQQRLCCARHAPSSVSGVGVTGGGCVQGSVRLWLKRWMQQLSVTHTANILLYGAYLIFYSSAANFYVRDFPADQDQFGNFRSFTETMQVARNCISICAFLSWFRVVIFLDVLPSFALLTHTLAHARHALVGLFFVAAIVLYSFGAACECVSSSSSSSSSAAVKIARLFCLRESGDFLKSLYRQGLTRLL